MIWRPYRGNYLFPLKLRFCRYKKERKIRIFFEVLKTWQKMVKMVEGVFFGGSTGIPCSPHRFKKIYV